MAIRAYEEYWRERSDPEWGGEEVAELALIAGELRLLWGGTAPPRVLELGCGNGALYPLLGLDDSVYRGVDLSPAMIEAFRHEHPALDLRVGDAATYRAEPGEAFDLIFSNGVLQYFDAAMLEEHFARAREMMHPGSVLVHGAVPWRAQRLRYVAGTVLGAFRTGVAPGVRALRDGAGFAGIWHRPSRVGRIAAAHGLRARYYGSLAYPYRFHVRLTPTP